jgi:multidrug efflux system membrane fusion protein
MNQRRVLVLIGGLAAAIIATAILRSPGVLPAKRVQPEPAALVVDVATARSQSMPVLLQAAGQIVSEHAVQVRPQVSGVLKQVVFAEGDSVAAGQRLFQIDAAPFEVTLESTKAAWENAAGNAGRLESLLTRGFVTPQDARNARAAASVAEAAYKQACINLAYTDIHAVISGRTGSIAVKAGNNVAPTDATPLVVINETQPILVQFSVPQQQLPRVRDYQAQQTIKVSVTRDDGTDRLDGGELVFIDNTVNPSTGTVLLKARLPNEHELLWPGQYVGVRMQLAVEPHAIVIPQTAMQTGQDGNYVFVVADHKAQARTIKVDRQVDDLAVIASGLAEGEQIVARVPRNLRVGSPVTPGSAAAPIAAEVTLPQRQ